MVLRLQNWLVKYGFVSGLPPAVTIHSHRAEEKNHAQNTLAPFLVGVPAWARLFCAAKLPGALLGLG